MAGRGTDIVLGGNPVNAEEAEYVKGVGGLHVLGSERHEARRIDNQLRGRTGRQGDPGSSRFYVALDDDLMRLFGGDRLAQFMDSGFLKTIGGNWEEGEAIESPLLTRQIEQAQRRVEANHFDVRKQLLDFDNVMNRQREAIYDLRNDILDGEDVSQQVKDMIDETLAEKIDLWCPEKIHSQDWDINSLVLWAKRTFDATVAFDGKDLSLDRDKIRGVLKSEIEKAYQAREESLTKEVMLDLERMILLQMIDTAWKDHLYDLDHLKQGIFLRGYAQKDPKIEYQKESFAMFEQMMNRIRESAVEFIFKLKAMPAAPQPPVQRMVERKPEFSIGDPGEKAMAPSNGGGATSPAPLFSMASKPSAVPTVTKIGRNDPCPCGSGKKYKKCHGG